MRSLKNKHPISRVRARYLNYGQRDMATAAGFARRLGCSVSLLRNVECGIFPLSKKLAARIQEVTGVSAEWLASNPGKDDPILDVEGNVWSPDYGYEFSLVENMVDLAQLLYLQMPSYLPVFVGAAVESLLTIKSPPSERPKRSEQFQAMGRYMDDLIEPVLRLIENLAPAEHEEFLNAMKRHLGGQHAAESDQLLNLWDLVTTHDNSRTTLRGDIQFLPVFTRREGPSSKLETTPEPANKSKSRKT